MFFALHWSYLASRFFNCGLFIGKHSPAPGTRSRSGDSPGRPHSAQSWRNKSEGNSLNNSKNNTSLPKSRNSSLVSARDSLSSKLRSTDSLLKMPPTSNNSFGTRCSTPVGTLKKTGTINKWTNSSSPKDEKVRSKTTSSIWSFSFFRRDNQT